MPDPIDLTLDQYVQRLIDEAHAFAANWRANHAVDPEHWPMEMGLADWDEQFIADTM